MWAVRGGGGLGVVIALGVDLAVPRDRKGSFEPQIVRTGQGPGRTPATAISPAGPPPEATRAASWLERPVHGARTSEKYRLKRPRSRQRALPAGPWITPMV